MLGVPQGGAGQGQRRLQVGDGGVQGHVPLQVSPPGDVRDVTSVFSKEEDTETEIEFRFQVPRLPDAASETRFRWAEDFIFSELL